MVDLDALGERSIIIDCDVLQADGGTRTASITGAFVALAIALQKLVEFRAIKKLPLRDYVAATSVGMLRGEAMLDLCYEEDSRAEVDMNVVMTGGGKFVELQATAEQEAFDDEQMAALIQLARAGIAELIQVQRRTREAAVTLYCATSNPASCANFGWLPGPACRSSRIAGIRALRRKRPHLRRERDREGAAL